MPRAARSIVGGDAYHVLNRANGRLRLFKKPADFLAFEHILAEVHQRVPLRILGYTLMGNHWHFVVWPRRGQDAEVSEFFRRFSVTHSMRFHARRNTLGMGHVWPGRFKSFPIVTPGFEIPCVAQARVDQPRSACRPGSGTAGRVQVYRNDLQFRVTPPVARLRDITKSCG
jgi:putative transposase